MRLLIVFILSFCSLYGFSSGNLVDSVRVPFDHSRPALGQFWLKFEYGGIPQPQKPIVFVIADGQQFFLTPGRIAKIQRDEFNNKVNLIGIPGRGAQLEVAEFCRVGNDSTDFVLAFECLKSEQWCRDVDAIRKSVLGEKEKINLYGGSGGGYLIHEYLTHFPQNVKHAFTYGSVNPHLDADAGRVFDRFYQDIHEMGPKHVAHLHQALAIFADERNNLVTALSRQHYFHNADELAAARAALLDSLADGNRPCFERIKDEYQVNGIKAFMETPRGLGIRVRIYEFFMPYRPLVDLWGEAVYPTLEMEYYDAEPLITLHDAGNVPAPEFHLQNLQECDAEVFLLAAGEDRASGYKSHITLHEHLPHSTLFIADDDHLFKTLKEENLFYSTAIAFFKQDQTPETRRRHLEQLRPFEFENRRR